jgi:hypothetical protein
LALSRLVYFLYFGETACDADVPISRKIPLSAVIENFHDIEADP